MTDQPATPGDSTSPGHSGATKAQLRATVLSARRARGPAQREAAGKGLVAQAATVVTTLRPQRVAGYVSFGTEPPTARLLASLHAGGIDVIVPVVRADLDLDWVDWRPSSLAEGPSSLAEGPSPLAEGPSPSEDLEGRLLGPDALAATDLVLVPALAVSRRRARLGRGGGSYDRALHRVPSDVPIIAIVYDEELVDELPTEEHDRSIDIALTPTRVVRLPPAPAG